MPLHSTKQVATLLGCHRSTVTRAAQKLGLGQMIGSGKGFTKGEIDQIRKAIKEGPGNPNFGRKAE
jgi:DNA-binding transcriptional regulator YhcF (GntR family)